MNKNTALKTFMLAALLPQAAPLLAIRNGLGQEVFTAPSVFQSSATLNSTLDVRDAGGGNSQVWRDSGGTAVATMTGTGIMISSGFRGDGSGLTGISTHTFKLGDIYGGGRVYKIDPSSRQVLIAADSDAGNFQWTQNPAQTGARRWGLNAGRANTIIITTNTGGGNYAAKYCADYVSSDGSYFYDDWYLPSSEELQELYNQRTSVGGFTGAYYWSSTEANSSPESNAVARNFSGGSPEDSSKSNSYLVRCVRSGSSVDTWPSLETAGFSVGDSYGGGRVFWTNANRTQALVVANANASGSPVSWAPSGGQTIGADKAGRFAGQANTVIISTTYGAGSYAARLCDEYSVAADGEYYDDWYLPSREELAELYNVRGKVGIALNDSYWSSTEKTGDNAYNSAFYSSGETFAPKINPHYPRCVRAAPAAPAGNSRYADYIAGGVTTFSTQTFTGSNTFKDVIASSITVGHSTFTVSLGRVGIGTSAPQALLDISPLGDQPAPLLHISTGTETLVVVSSYGSVGIGLPSPATTTALHVYKQVRSNVAALREFPRAVNGDLYVDTDMDGDDVSIGGQFAARAHSDRNPGYIIALNAEAERTQSQGTGAGTLQAAIGLRVGNFRNYTSGGGGKVVNTYGILIDSQTSGAQDYVYPLYSADRYAPAYFNGPLAASSYRIGVSTVLTNNFEQGLRLGHNTVVGQLLTWDNTYIGNEVGLNSAGYENTFVGGQAGYENTVGIRNSALGVGAMRHNRYGDLNVVVGYNAGRADGSDQAYSSSTMVGAYAGYYGGNYSYADTLIGFDAGHFIQGSSNTFLGARTGADIYTGARNIIIGAGQPGLGADTNDFLNLGGVLYGDLNNKTLAIGSPQALSAENKLMIRGEFNAGMDVAGASVAVSNLGGGSTYGVYARAISPGGNPQDAYGGYFLSSGPVGNLSYGIYAYGLDYSLYADGGKNYLKGMTGVGVDASVAMLEVQGVDANAYTLTVGTDANYHFVVSTNGMVGVGTNTPSAAFDVAKPARLAKQLTKAENTGRNLTGSDFGRTLVVDNAAAQTFYLTTASAADIGATVTFVKLNTGKLTIQAQGGNYIGASASGGGIYNDAVTPPDAAVTLRLVTAAKWVIVSGQGAWISY